MVTRGVSIALACRAFGMSETCFRYSPKRDEENDRIADLLVGVTRSRKTWGFGLCFLHLERVAGIKIQDSQLAYDVLPFC